MQRRTWISSLFCFLNIFFISQSHAVDHSSLTFSLLGNTTLDPVKGGAFDGTGDLIHTDRFAAILDVLERTGHHREFTYKGYKVGETKAYPLGFRPPQSLENPGVYLENLRAIIDIRVSAYPGLIFPHRYGAIYFSEYPGGQAKDYFISGENIIYTPLGLTCGFGYMKPLLPIDVTETKESLFSRLAEEWRNLIFGENYNSNTVFVLGYYSPNKDINPELLVAFSESAFARGKKVVFFLKGSPTAVEKIREKIQDPHQVITTREFVPDDQWHILSQLADLQLATGDSSSSDPFFFQSLAFWNAHKKIESKAWLMVADKWLAPKYVNKERIREFIRLTSEKGKNIPQFADFVRTIDQEFMNDWKEFCAYIERHYTLTPKKTDLILKISTEILRERKTAFTPESQQNLYLLFMQAKGVLNPESIGCLLLQHLLYYPLNIDPRHSIALSEQLRPEFKKSWDSLSLFTDIPTKLKFVKKEIQKAEQAATPAHSIAAKKQSDHVHNEETIYDYFVKAERPMALTKELNSLLDTYSRNNTEPDFEKAEALIAEGADASINIGIFTPLEEACLSNDKETIKFLLNYGAGYYVNYAGQTIIMFARDYWCKDDVIELLQTYPVDVNAVGRKG
ncbi:MAG: ankyrin repeat domain-containing protein [Alphaproteobacteria bacterium]|nr:ankyrin repeat domain-containing protein [Alphaproteobacteria bacterium]